MPLLPPPSKASSSPGGVIGTEAKAGALVKVAASAKTGPKAKALGAAAKAAASAIPSPPSPADSDIVVGGDVPVPKAKAAAAGSRSRRKERPFIAAVGEGSVWYDDYKHPFKAETYGNWHFFVLMPAKRVQPGANELEASFRGT